MAFTPPKSALRFSRSQGGGRIGPLTSYRPPESPPVIGLTLERQVAKWEHYMRPDFQARQSYLHTYLSIKQYLSIVLAMCFILIRFIVEHIAQHAPRAWIPKQDLPSHKILRRNIVLGQCKICSWILDPTGYLNTFWELIMDNVNLCWKTGGIHIFLYGPRKSYIRQNLTRTCCINFVFVLPKPAVKTNIVHLFSLFTCYRIINHCKIKRAYNTL